MLLFGINFTQNVTLGESTALSLYKIYSECDTDAILFHKFINKAPKKNIFLVKCDTRAIYSPKLIKYHLICCLIIIKTHKQRILITHNLISSLIFYFWLLKSTKCYFFWQKKQNVPNLVRVHVRVGPFGTSCAYNTHIACPEGPKSSIFLSNLSLLLWGKGPNCLRQGPCPRPVAVALAEASGLRPLPGGLSTA